MCLSAAVAALSAILAERRELNIAKSATDAADMLADIVTAFPTVLDLHPTVLAELACCAAVGAALPRCLEAYVARLPLPVLASQLAMLASKAVAPQVCSREPME